VVHLKSLFLWHIVVSLGEWCQSFEAMFSSYLQGLKCPVRSSSLDVFRFLHEPAEAGNYTYLHLVIFFNRFEVSG